MIDYIIVGAGLAGIAFVETALQQDKTILVFDAELSSASKVAAGLYNPVILKRFTPLADAHEHLDLLHQFYGHLKTKINAKLDYPMPILRRFASVEEQNNWFKASDNPGMTSFLSVNLIKRKYNGIDSSFGYGEVNQTGYVNVSLLLDKYQTYLLKSNLIRTDMFDYSKVEFFADSLKYKGIEARHIIFAEGFGMHANPFFSGLPLDGAKGELLIIKAPDLDLDVILNSSVFILPLGDDLFKVGATYNWTDKTDSPTTQAKQELSDRLCEILTCDFEIISHFAGVRPTVKDRKPLLGTHSEHHIMHILNGLGTRGVMLGPAMAKMLFNHIEMGIPLPREIDIKRFEKRK